ncbi:MAG: hypothetical protein Q9180_007484 [Flavoplaca navasiana]
MSSASASTTSTINDKQNKPSYASSTSKSPSIKDDAPDTEANILPDTSDQPQSDVEKADPVAKPALAGFDPSSFPDGVEQLLAQYRFMDPIFDRLLHVRRGMLVFYSLSDNLRPRVESTVGQTASEYGWLLAYSTVSLTVLAAPSHGSFIFSLTSCRLDMGVFADIGSIGSYMG